VSVHRKGPWIITALAALAGAVILMVAVMIEPSQPTEVKVVKPRIVDANDLQVPGALRADEGRTGDNSMDSQGIALERGAWVQVADETGRLAQQYSASRIDPERDKWMRMQQPRAVMYPSGGRIVTMSSQRGRMRVPDRAIESGRLEETVIIRMYKPVVGKAIDIAHDQPALVVEADEALFDSRLGEIRCDRKVTVVTDQVRFEGEGLTMLLLPDGKTIERLTVERPLGPIQIVRRLREVANTQATTPAPPPTPAALTETPAAPHGGPRWQPADVLAQQSPAATADPFRLYRLVLEKNVRVVRDGAKGRTRINGDRLISVFSLESDAMGSNLASVMDGGLHRVAADGVDGAAFLTDHPVDSGASSMPFLLLSTAMAVGMEQIERTEIRYEGRLTMVLTTDPADRLANKNEMRVDVQGTPTSMDDEGSGARIDCGLLSYTTGADAVAIEAQLGKRFLLASPRLDLEATRFDLNRSTGKGLIMGAGRMRLGGADGAAVQAVAQLPKNAANAALAAGTAASGVHTVAAADVPASSRTVRMQWSKSVDLEFQPGSEAARLVKADFVGAVHADADEVMMDAEHVLVQCVPQGSRDAVKRLLAEGAAKATRQPEGSSLAGSRIELFLEPLADGGSRPLRLLADGSVEAFNNGQRLWADSMDCSFKPAASDLPQSERMDLDEMRTRGEVQALVSQDARVWATSMQADPQRKHVTLHGPQLLLVRGNAVADGMSEIEMDEFSGEGSAPGQGRCQYFLQSLADAAPKPLPRPTIPASPQMVATWQDGLLYRRIDPTSSVLQLAGSVHASTSRTPRQLDEMVANEAILTLTRDESRLSRARSESADSDLGSDTSSLTRMHATGDVQLESRAWACDDRSDEPRLFRLMANEVIHDLSTGESEVPTPGTLLIFDRDDEGAKGLPSSLFDGRGTTRFRWAKRLDMKQQGVPGRYRIDFDSEVEMLHAGLRAQDTLTLTCDRMEATVQRQDEIAAPQQRQEAKPANLGGTVKLLRIQGMGRVFVRTADMDVECDTFDYDLHTQIATLTARPGRTIAVLQKGVKGQPSPIRAESALWDMQSGRIRIIGASGTGIR